MEILCSVQHNVLPVLLILTQVYVFQDAVQVIIKLQTQLIFVRLLVFTCTYYVVNITNGNSHQCLTQCPSAYPFADSGLCVAHCMLKWPPISYLISIIICTTNFGHFQRFSFLQRNSQCLQTSVQTL
ncbi:Hypothetical_protein [Hexamita inflata]|uniref:Hypothetical_protein n=1 Tax=Hexamita inflata TaxID=28002 RepID=A0AA86UBH8_9EUKA|nr:Hypothetical protein HINF_LOCUS33571 [Hexamita inflata]